MARSSGVDQRSLVHETALALRALRGDATGLVVSCRRILEKHPACGALWSLSARALMAADPYSELTDFGRAVANDPTAELLVDSLPEGATVCVLGWPDLIDEALARRGDLAVRVVNTFGEGERLARRLRSTDMEADLVPVEALGTAVADSDLVLLDVSASGPDAVLSTAGARAAAAVAYCATVPVWAVVGMGRRLPGPLWRTLLAHIDQQDLWDRSVEVVPAGLVSHVVGANGVVAGTSELDQFDCPAAPELLRLVHH